MKYLLRGLIALLGMSVLPAFSAERPKVYYLGQKVPADPIEKKIICYDQSIIDQLLAEVTSTYKPADAIEFLRHPAKGADDGRRILRDELMQLGTANLIMLNECPVVSDDLIIMSPIAIEWIGEMEVVTAFVVNKERRAGFTFFFNIRVLMPRLGTKEYELFSLVTATLNAEVMGQNVLDNVEGTE